MSLAATEAPKTPAIQQTTPEMEAMRHEDVQTIIPQRQAECEQNQGPAIDSTTEKKPLLKIYWCWRNVKRNGTHLRHYLGAIHPAFDVVIDWAAVKEEEQVARSFLTKRIMILPEERRLPMINHLSERKRPLTIEIYKSLKKLEDETKRKQLEKIRARREEFRARREQRRAAYYLLNATEG